MKRYIYIEMTDEQYQDQRNELSNISKIGMRICNADIEQAYKDQISPLITTIESQKEEIEEFKEFQSEVADEYSWMNRLLNSYLKSENKLIAEIESLKAITELAVKGLKEVESSQLVSPSKTLTIARSIISEIERLSHE